MRARDRARGRESKTERGKEREERRARGEIERERERERERARARARKVILGYKAARYSQERKTKNKKINLRLQGGEVFAKVILTTAADVVFAVMTRSTRSKCIKTR